MRTTITVLILVGLALVGCDIHFPNQEMDLAGSGRTRPFAVVCEPAEAMPGEPVTVKLYFYEPDPAACSVSWKVALDYDIGLYGTDEVERNHVTPTVDMDVAYDAHGFGYQEFVFEVPDDVLRNTSAHPEVIFDPLIVGLARSLLGLGDDEPVTRAAVVDLLATGDPLGNPDIDTQAFLWLSDLFSCQIRFRASLQSGVSIDAVKNLTVRYSRRFDSLNVNDNTRLHIGSIFVIPHPDVKFEDRIYYIDDVENYSFDELPDLRIPAHDDWTYYVTRSLGLQDYSSPFASANEGEGSVGGFRERYIIKWFGYDLTSPGSGFPLFIAEDGDEAEMGDLTDVTRIRPPVDGREHRFRILGVLRDSRQEWEKYGFAPGSSVDAVDFTFTPAE